MKILYIPDCQVKEGVSTDHLDWISQYIIDKRPDVIVNGGDFADMPSLSSYDVGKKSFEGRRYMKDISAVVAAQDRLLSPIHKLQDQQRRNKQKVYNPKLYLTLGNHEQRIERAVESDPKLEGLIKYEDLGYEVYGWEVIPYLQPLMIEGVAFSHYFTTGAKNLPSSTANAQLNKQHMSCIAGHQQGLQIATAHRADGTRLTSVIAGSCYLHDEQYRGNQGNVHWRGILMLHDVHDGEFDLMPVSLKYLKQRYER